jgi:hypothetical protein
MSGNSPIQSNTTLLRSKQVAPLPTGPGGNNPMKQQMNQTNIQLAMITAQAAANTKYDPPVPQPVSKQAIIEKFTPQDQPLHTLIMIVGGLFIVYGLVTK